MDHQTLAAHEAVDLHEIVNFKTLCIAKSKLMQGLVFDQDLKDLMQKDVQQSIQDLTELQAVYERAPFQAPVPQSRPTPIIN
ncbi:spore gernimation protein GerQ [Bacillus sp. FSL H8-0515]|uniref:spore gernimation protein GerQ n=1 Tax=Bacillus sp. FSL H8-0515 TaxID=2921396 RepID=UPI0022812C8A|nr:spore gernimation protein GerQ [Bacillus sp. S20C3]MCY8204218.1 spore gernimation protein GerQ [Bacillus sp. N12A5]MCY8286738.1 spore gernimation protein GerQ [Bacillus sp. N13C7]MCY8637105.1 spore gernimation protein GerQ [Bacillus sp. S17B2]MCY8720990.1 spore gernimation protein GerQ [Bacillus sp. S10C12M]MCY9143469.1 spore gernimation protein GerQ [Bacillus sp. T9C1]